MLDGENTAICRLSSVSVCFSGHDSQSRTSRIGRIPPIALQHSFTVQRVSPKNSERQKPTQPGHRGDARLCFVTHESSPFATPPMTHRESRAAGRPSTAAPCHVPFTSTRFLARRRRKDNPKSLTHNGHLGRPLSSQFITHALEVRPVGVFPILQ